MKGRAGKLRLSVALGVSLVASLALVAAAFGRADSSAAPAASAASDRQAVACSSARIGAHGAVYRPGGVDRPGAAQVGPLLGSSRSTGEQDERSGFVEADTQLNPAQAADARDAAQADPNVARRHRPRRQPGDPGGRPDLREGMAYISASATNTSLTIGSKRIKSFFRVVGNDAAQAADGRERSSPRR